MVEVFESELGAAPEAPFDAPGGSAIEGDAFVLILDDGEDEDVAGVA